MGDVLGEAAEAAPHALADRLRRLEAGGAEGRVRGIGGLRVVDASIFPVVPCANTNFPVLMAAEKIADAMLAGAVPAAAVDSPAMG